MRKRSISILVAMIMAIQLFGGISGMGAVSGKIGKLYRYPDTEVKVYWTESEKGSVITENIARNYFKIGDDVGYCLDHSYEASMTGVLYDKITDDLKAADKQRISALLTNGYPNRVKGDKPLGFTFGSDTHLRIGTQIALWRLMKDIGSPSERGKNFDFNSPNSYYNKSRSNSPIADQITAFAEALYKKAKQSTTLIWNKIDSSKANNRTTDDSKVVSGSVIRKGPYTVTSNDDEAKFYLTLYKGSKNTDIMAEQRKAAIVDIALNPVKPGDPLKSGQQFYIEIWKDKENSGQEYTVRQTPAEKTKKINYEIFKCDYKNWQRLITAVNEEIPPASLTVNWTDTISDNGRFRIKKTGENPFYESRVPLENAEFTWYIWSEAKGRYLDQEGEMEETADSVINPEDNPTHVMITDQDGTAESPRIAITDDNQGKVLLKETGVPEGYTVQKQDSWEIVLDQDKTVEMDISNTAKYYKLRILKLDASTKETIKGFPARFRLYDHEKKPLNHIYAPLQLPFHQKYDGRSDESLFFDDFYTDPETGTYLFDGEVFSPGTYYFQEIKSPGGYVMPILCNQCGYEYSEIKADRCLRCGSGDVAGKLIEFELGDKENAAVINIAITNEKQSSAVKVIKRIKGEPRFPSDLKDGFMFELFKKEDVDLTGPILKLKEKARPLDRFGLNSAGEGICTKEPGEYYIREASAPPGIYYDPNIIYYADLRVPDSVCELHIENAYTLEQTPAIPEETLPPATDVSFREQLPVPRTGENSNSGLYLIMIAGFTLGVFAVFIIKKRI